MFELSFGDRYREGVAKANNKTILNMAKRIFKKTIAEVTGLTEAEIQLILK